MKLERLKLCWCQLAIALAITTAAVLAAALAGNTVLSPVETARSMPNT
ncbi:MAG: hypothetical protein AB7U75_08005 [Hyphomicrobiaceae bacterium]